MQRTAPPVRTTWRPMPAWDRAPSPTATLQPDVDALRALLMQSIRAGHRRVAVQRFMKLQACGAAVAHEARTYCESALRALRPREAAQVAHGARQWAQHVGRGAAFR